jgi:serine/threonine-protein kinase
MPEDTGYIVRVGSNDEYTCEVLEGHVTVRSKTGSWQPVALNKREQVTASGRSTLSRRTLSRRDYNKLVNRVNAVERVYRPRSVELMAPDVVGMTEADAQKVLRTQGFGRTTIVGVVTKKRPIGEVVAQSPLAGVHIKPGSALRLEVEVKPTSVPNVIGSNLESARSLLERAQLKLGKIQDQLEVGVESGIVRSQSEPANKNVAPGTEIDLVVTERGAEVPSLNGLKLSEAERVLRKANLRLGDETKRVSTATVDTVIDQDPDPNDIVRENSKVDVVLAEKEVRYCTIPNVSGLTPAQAASRVKSADFKVTSKGSGSHLSGTKPTEPEAGTSLPCGSTVTIYTVIG